MEPVLQSILRRGLQCPVRLDIVLHAHGQQFPSIWKAWLSSLKTREKEKKWERAKSSSTIIRSQELMANIGKSTGSTISMLFRHREKTRETAKAHVKIHHFTPAPLGCSALPPTSQSHFHLRALVPSVPLAWNACPCRPSPPDPVPTLTQLDFSPSDLDVCVHCLPAAGSQVLGSRATPRAVPGW